MSLVKIVFGSKLDEIQQHYLHLITEEDNVLILGGGSGSILKYIKKCRKISYVDKSYLMINLAQSVCLDVPITFQTCDYRDYVVDEQYSIIVCPFFLDCFSPINLTKVLRKIRSQLLPNGRLLVMDFSPHRKRAFLLYFMHFFFKIFANLESTKIQDIHSTVVNEGFEVEYYHNIDEDFIFSGVYRN